MIEWLTAGAFIACVGIFGWAMWRAGYLKGWDSCARVARFQRQRLELRKAVDMERDRLMRKRLRRDAS